MLRCAAGMKVSGASARNQQYHAARENLQMTLTRRQFVGVACASLAVMPWAFAARAATAPVVAVIDVDQPDARAAADKFAAMLSRHFAGQAVRPRFVFVPSQFLQHEHQINERNAAVLRQAVIASGADILLAGNDGYAQLLRMANLGKPILFYTVLDPVAIGLTDSLTRPGKGMTGFAMGTSSDLKRFEMLLRLAPKARNIGRLSSAGFDREGSQSQVRPSVSSGNTTTQRFEFDTREQLVKLFAGSAARRMDAWDVSYSTGVFLHSEAVVQELARLQRPVIYPRMKFIQIGGMAAFEPRIEEADEAWVSQVALLMAGVPIEKIPVMQATRYRFGLNLKACRRVGVEPPKSLIRIADTVID